MTIERAREILEIEGIDTKVCLIYPRAYVHGALCLTYGDDYWYHVTNNDRDGSDDKFPSEADACDAFIKLALSDPTNRTAFRQTDLIDWPARRRQLLDKYGLGET